MGMSGHVDDRLLAYLERRLTAAERAQVTAHLDACPRCRASVGHLAEAVEDLSPLPGALRALPVRAAHQWPGMWARVRAAGVPRRLGPQVSVYLGLVTSLMVVVSVVPGAGHGAPSSVTAGVAAGPLLTQPATVVFHAANAQDIAGTAAQLPEPAHQVAPTLAGTLAVEPIPIPTPGPRP
jgi:anti-sigma factor RsiW